MSGSLCYKCHASRPAYKIRLQQVCRACFTANTEHCFRCTLKTCIYPRKGENLLICVSGGPNSSSMLSLIDTCNNPDKTTKMMKFLPTILIIDDTSFYNLPAAALEDYMNKITELYHIPIHCRKLEEISPDIHVRLPTDPQSKADFLYMEIHKAFVVIAKELDISKIVTGESASRVSALVFSGICKGSGVSVNSFAKDCLEVDGVKIGRPMRELLDKEVAIYQHLMKVPVLTKLETGSERHEELRIDHLVEGFLHNLQSKFPSTVHTLLRTASKLVPGKVMEVCRLCGGPKDSPVCELEKFGQADESLCYACHHFVN